MGKVPSGSVVARDDTLMGRALRAAAQGHPSPNPHVGAVVARGAEVIATGYHRRAGEDHAEVMAMRRAGRRARGATLYVTVEPCNHVGRTGPCTDAIIAAGVRRVVIGCLDPAPHVPGATRKLRRAGIEVAVGVREAAAQDLIADFAKHIVHGIPYVLIKGAVTLDGRTATRSGDSKWITGEAARRMAHRLRDRADAVMVGVGTVLADDPALTVRDVRGRNPLRVVLDSRLRTPDDAKVLAANGGGVLLFHGRRAAKTRIRALTARGADLVAVPETASGLDLGTVLRELGRRDIVRLMVEGGAKVHGNLLGAGHADAAAVFVAPRIMADDQAIPLARGGPVADLSAAFRLVAPRVQRFGDDVLFEGQLARNHAGAPRRG